jgi:adenylate kinase family enzyme
MTDLPPPKQNMELKLLAIELVANDSWIIDGNYRSTFHIRFPVADMIIFFDFPKWLCLWRAIKRRFQYHNQSRDDLGGINKERVTWSYLKWILTYPRQETLEKLKEYSGSKKIAVFKNPADVRKFMKEANEKNQMIQ